MQLGVLITNHGKHSNEKLAIACASDIIQIGASAAEEDAIDGRKLENKIVEILEASFAKLAEFEHAGIEAKGTEHLAAEYVAHPEIYDAALKDIMAAIDASSIVSWFADQAARAARDGKPAREPITREQIEGNVVRAVNKWLLSGHHMHRDWFARSGKVGHGAELKDSDKHDTECEHVKAWLAKAA